MDNYNLIKKLRRENYPKYQNLIKMHLSLTEIALDADQAEALWKMDMENFGGSCSNSIDKKTNSSVLEKLRSKVAGKKNLKSISPPQTYAGVLGSGLTQERFTMVILNVIKFLNQEDNVRQEGIFRKSGSQSRQNVLLAAFQRGELTNFGAGEDGSVSFNVHDVATALKNFLRELNEPLFSGAHFSIYCQIAEWSTCMETLSNVERVAVQNRQLRIVRLLLLMLPELRFDTLYHILRLLQRVAQHHKINLMTASNLAKILTPMLFVSRTLSDVEFRDLSKPLSILLTLLIERVDDVFMVPCEVIRDINIYYQATAQSMVNEFGCDSRTEKGNSSAACPLQRNDSVLVALTTVTFVDKARSTADMQAINTKTALAALYADVQLMPEGKEKTRLLKQFQDHNRKNYVCQPSGQRNIISRAMDGVHNGLLNRLKRGKVEVDENDCKRSSKKQRIELELVNETMEDLNDSSSGLSPSDNIYKYFSSPLEFSSSISSPCVSSPFYHHLSEDQAGEKSTGPLSSTMRSDRGTIRMLDMSQVVKSSSNVTNDPKLTDQEPKVPTLPGIRLIYTPKRRQYTRHRPTNHE